MIFQDSLFMHTVSHSENLEIPNKTQGSGLFRFCFAGLVAAIFYPVIFILNLK